MEDPYIKYNVRATHAALILPSKVDVKDIIRKLLVNIAASFMVELARDQDPWLVN